MIKIISLIVSVMFMFIIFSCQKSTSPEDSELELSTLIEEQAGLGWEVNDLVMSSLEIGELTSTSNYIQDDGIGDYAGLTKLKNSADLLKSSVHDLLEAGSPLQKPQVDSLIYYFDNSLSGTRRALYYDPQTSLARFYEVRYKFILWRNLTYDSLEIVVDLNHSPDLADDDKLVSISHQQFFKQNFFLQSIVEQLTITSYEENEPSGFQAFTDATYAEDFFLTRLYKSVQFNPDKSGNLREDFYFKDGKTAYRRVTLNMDHSGAFEKKLRDGTIISGTFDSAEDDLSGFFTELIEFPDGRYLDKIYKSAAISISLPDSILTAQFSKIVYFSDLRIDSAAMTVKISNENNVKTTVISATKPNQAFGTLTIIENESGATLQGEWTTWNKYYILIEAEYYASGGGQLHYDVYKTEADYLNGALPLLSADYYLAPDNSGTGHLSADNKTYKIEFYQYGEAILSLDGKSKSINIFR